MAISKKVLVGISLNFLHSIRTSKNVIKIGGDFGAIFWKKAWAIVQGIFSEIGSFFKMAITQKVLVGISSNFLHSIGTSICIRKFNKNWG